MSETRRSPVALYVGGMLLVALVVGLVVGLAAMKRASVAREAHDRAATVAAGPRVRTVTVVQSPGHRTITLTGEARPFLDVTLYSKVSGYLKSIVVDKGDRVRAGQILAIVESPETDQEYAGAVADAANKRTIAARDQQLVGNKLIAPEEAEQAETDAKLAIAKKSRYATLKDYETLRAPFSGTVTARFADPGALVQNAENSQTSALPVVTIGQTDSLRVYVYLDQQDANDVRDGSPVEITDPGRPGVRVIGTVTRSAGSLDPNTRTLLAEIDVNNRRGTLVPGGMVQVAVKVTAPSYLEVPVEALIPRGDSQFVAVVPPDNRVTFKQVHVADTDGQLVRLRDGVAPGDRVALNLGDAVAEGQRVQPASDDTPPARPL
jgi:RND family efflux transporter MFP subunit